MNKVLYVLMHTHRHGVDLFPFLFEEGSLAPTRIKDFAMTHNIDYEPDREDEFLEWTGPWTIGDIELGE